MAVCVGVPSYPLCSMAPFTPSAVQVDSGASMSSPAVERVSTLSLSVQQLGRLPRLLDVLPSFPSLRGTVLASDVPSLFREPYIFTGYRPTGQDWSYYFLSLFQTHNESLNVWTHLLSLPVMLLRCWAFVGAWSVVLDASSLPLLLYVLSVLTCLSCSAIAHLFQSRSELAHCSFFFLDYVGIGIYQYGCALASYFYSADPAWRKSIVEAIFLPCAAILGWASCTSCCYAKLNFRRPYPLQKKIFQVIPSGLNYILVISPVAHRLATGSWKEHVLALHALQVLFFLLAAFFFSCHLPERLFPGQCDIVGHGHQLFHILLSFSLLCQQEALLHDFLAQRETVVHVHGEECLHLASASFGLLVLCSAATAYVMHRRVQQCLELKQE